MRNRGNSIQASPSRGSRSSQYSHSMGSPSPQLYNQSINQSINQSPSKNPTRSPPAASPPRTNRSSISQSSNHCNYQPQPSVSPSSTQSLDRSLHQSLSQKSINHAASHPVNSIKELISDLQFYPNDRSAVILANQLDMTKLSSRAYHPPIEPLAHMTQSNPSIKQINQSINQLRNIAQPTTLPQSTFDAAVKLSVIHLAYHCHTIILQSLLQSISSIAPHLGYWKRYPNGTLMSRLNSWLIDSIPLIRSITMTDQQGLFVPLMSADQKLDCLIRMKRRWMDRLGRVAHRQGAMHVWLTMMMPINRIAQYENESYVYMQSVHRMINGEFFDRAISPSNYQSNNQTVNQSVDTMNILSIIESALSGLPEFTEWFNDQLSPLAHPSFFARHWLTLGGASVVGALAARKAYVNRDLITQSAVQSVDSLKLFVAGHVTEPLTEIYNDLFTTLHQRSLMADAKQNLAASQLSLTQMLRDFSAKHSDSTFSKAELSHMADTGDLTVVMKHYTNDITKPFRSLLFGDLAQSFLIQIQQMKVQGEAAMVTLDQLLSANNINFNVLATIPALLLAGVTFVGIKNTLWRIAHTGKNRRAIIETVKRRLASIELCCIVQFYHNDQSLDQSNDQIYGRARLQEEALEQLALGDETAEQSVNQQTHQSVTLSSEENDDSDEELNDDESINQAIDPWIRLLSVKCMNDVAYGHVLMSLHMMPTMRYAAQSAQQYNDWLIDLALLADPAITPNQKMMTINKIYRQYTFLQPLVERWI